MDKPDNRQESAGGLRRFLRECGQAMVEYVMILAFISLAAVTAAGTLGNNVKDSIKDTDDRIAGVQEYTLSYPDTQIYRGYGTFRVESDAEIGRFVELIIDGETLGGGNYAASAGSDLENGGRATLITFTEEYMQGLSIEEHPVEVVSDNGSASGSFTPNPVYTVTYNANGGTGAPEEQKKYCGEPLTLSTAVPQRTYYVFRGWADSYSKTSPDYSPGSEYTDDADVTLYALWNTSSYTVTYNANGGTGAPAAQTTESIYDTVLSTVKPTRTGYSFGGWALTSTAGTAAYTSGSTYSGRSSVTLYAVWNSIGYIVTYNANGGSGAPSLQSKTYGQTITLSSARPTRSGYTFLGWGTSSGATYASYSPGASYSGNSDLFLYAVWQTDSYTVSYNANGGSGAPSSQTKNRGTTLTLSSTVPTRSGYTFKGWGTSSTSTSASYQAGGSYSSDASITLYAVWEKEASFYYRASLNTTISGSCYSGTRQAHVEITVNSNPAVTGRSDPNYAKWTVSISPVQPYQSNEKIWFWGLFKLWGTQHMLKTDGNENYWGNNNPVYCEGYDYISELSIDNYNIPWILSGTMTYETNAPEPDSLQISGDGFLECVHN